MSDQNPAPQEAAAAGPENSTPLIVSRFDLGMEPAMEEEPIFTIGAIAEDGRPVALLLDPETRAKVGGWLVPSRPVVLREAATVAGEFPSRYADMDAMKAAGVIGPHTMSTVIHDELCRLADAAEQDEPAQRFELADPDAFTTAPDGADEYGCPCPDPDDQYLFEIDEGSVFLTHKACGKSPRGDWWQETLSLPQVPVTITAVPYGTCDGSEWHGEYRCDCGRVAAVQVTDRAVMHDGVPYLIGRAYTDRDGEQWQITDIFDNDGNPRVFLLPEGAGTDVPLAEIVADFGPLTLHTT